MAKGKTLGGTGKVSKTAKASMGAKGRKGRENFCPVHPDRPLVAAQFVEHTGRPQNGWICGAKGMGNIETTPETHYLTFHFKEYIP